MTNKQMIKEFLEKNTEVCSSALTATSSFIKEEHGVELSERMIKLVTSNLRAVQHVLSTNPELDIRNDTRQAQQEVISELNQV